MGAPRLLKSVYALRRIIERKLRQRYTESGILRVETVVGMGSDWQPMPVPVPPPPPPDEGPCEHCFGIGAPYISQGVRAPIMTSYPWPEAGRDNPCNDGVDPNKPPILCPGCTDAWVDYWQEQLAEYNAGLL